MIDTQLPGPQKCHPRHPWVGAHSCLRRHIWPVAYALLSQIRYVWCYQPESGKMNDWAIREAYLLLREREKAGVEPISKDLIDPEKLLAHLPSDEELKEAGVVINI